MPFRLEGPPPGELRSYVPEALGNRALAEPMRLIIRNPTEAQKREAYAQVRTSIVMGQDGKPLHDDKGRPHVRVDLGADEMWRRRVLEHCLVGVENFQIRGPAETWVDVKVDDFYRHAPRELLHEVSEEMLTAYSLTDDAKKKSAASSVLSPATTHHSAGTVTTVEPEGSASGEAAMAMQRQTSESLRG